MRQIERDIVSALIFSKDGKLFQGMKGEGMGGVYADSWHIPGGGVEEGEDKKSALIREIKEETGIDISSYGIELIDSSGKGETQKRLKTGEQVLCKMQFYVYKVIVKDKNASEVEVKLGGDLETFEWMDIVNLKKCKLTPPSAALFKKLKYI